jgi:Universal stress protein family
MLDPLDTNEIVIATDGSAGASLAVDQGVWLAKMLGAKVTFVAVARAPWAILGDPYYQRALAADLAKARTAIADAILAAEERRVSYETEILEGARRRPDRHRLTWTRCDHGDDPRERLERRRSPLRPTRPRGAAEGAGTRPGRPRRLSPAARGRNEPRRAPRALARPRCAPARTATRPPHRLTPSR